MKDIYRYSISDRKFLVEYSYDERGLTKEEYEQENLKIKEEEIKFQLYDLLNKSFLVLNGIFFAYWIYKYLKNDRRKIKKYYRKRSYTK